jgi:hypothetical protein
LRGWRADDADGRGMFNLPESDIDVANDVPFWHPSDELIRIERV